VAFTSEEEQPRLRAVKTAVTRFRIGRGVSALIAVAAASLISCEQDAPAGPDELSQATILTPPAPATPRINGPKIFGVRPGSPFLFQIPATGERPMEFAASELPDGLALDPATGRITGDLQVAGRHVVSLRATNRLGTAERPLTIVAGEQIALTPPMGWNSWNVWSGHVSQEKVLAAAQAMAANQLRDHGWSYVNIDDGWQGVRGGSFNAILPNKKFPDMKTLSDEVHGMGLKLGIYSTPWRTSFLGHIGSSADTADGRYDWIETKTHTSVFKYRHSKDESWLENYSWLQPLAHRQKERRRSKVTRRLRTFGQFSFVERDVKQWAEWGVDYLKYDWVPIDLQHTAAMQQQLLGSGRDIVFTVSNNAKFALAEDLSRLTNAWRTLGDMKDSWESMTKSGFGRDKWAPFNGPGHYNDSDMLVLGRVGWGKPRRTNLTADEQYTHMSLWCLLSAPLLLGCDLEKLDAFTIGLLTNNEVLDVNQDALCGSPAGATQMCMRSRWKTARGRSGCSTAGTRPRACR
jgi:alpha-galactosidase